ncbi:5-formyltetrahydrofolate cyclo-ligase [Desulfovirgula thermocuniculi]|uniref:5-formyltetrahydrofolate cyclo-ligase n=1 Tax=Desulfovirgula thermocuniculi TaxID=348842 RepID=UPI001FE069F5|nr:5-formyltetrahydrofolate cyclo-ligase [Desulfovirgula thermocuniculi]
MSKSELRREVLKARSRLSPLEVAQKSELITRRVLSLGEFRRARTIMAYVDFRNEVKTGELIRASMAMGKRVAVPLTDLQHKRLIPSLLQDFPGDLAPGAWGILEPRPGSLRPLEPEELDLVIVPGVAFDEKGNRLGYGGGFYDRFLPQTRPGTVWLALAFELQICPEISPGPHDCPVHLIVTEERVIYTGATRGPTASFEPGGGISLGCQHCAPHDEESKRKALEGVFAQYRGTKGALIPLLQEAQEIYGYLPKEVMEMIAAELRIPLSKVFGVATFYAQFHLKPRGRNIVRICQGTACHVRGASRVFEAVSAKLGVGRNETTPDLRYTLETVACLGACGLAPVMMVNDDTHGRLTPERAASVLEQYE